MNRNQASVGARARRLAARLARRWTSFRYKLDGNALRFTVQTLKPISGRPQPDRRRLVLFAHYDAGNEVDEYVRYYLQCLYELGSTIVFVSGSPRLKAESARSIEPFCAGIYTRKTLTLDFGSWHLAWHQMLHAGWTLEDFDQFLLANDSVYGPMFDLREMFSTFAGADMYGVTESLEFSPHLQSYFLLWNLNDATRRFLQSFWKQFQYIESKDELVSRYEIGISVQAREAGLRQQPYLSDAAVREAAKASASPAKALLESGEPLNHTLQAWDLLIDPLRSPFLKTSLARRSSDPEAMLTALQPLLAGRSGYDTQWIANHVRRLAQARHGAA